MARDRAAWQEAEPHARGARPRFRSEQAVPADILVPRREVHQPLHIFGTVTLRLSMMP